VITFPQGTTKSFKVRKNFLILWSTIIVVPIVIDGFRRSFDKRTKNEKSESFIIKEPLDINYDTDTIGIL
jgi:hypothetical protein